MKTILSFCICTLLICYATNTMAQPAGLDPSFGNNGIATSAIALSNNSANTKFSMQQQDGKILMTINMEDFFALVRLNTNGSIDNSFGADGKILFADTPHQVELIQGLIQPDGKIVAVGRIDDHMYIVRFNPDGSLDNSFGLGGKAFITIDPLGDCATAVAIQTDGKLVVAGFSGESSHYQYSVARLNINGSLDSDFDTDGKKEFAIGVSSYPHSVFVQGSGKILLAGNSYTGVKMAFSIARLDANGNLDATFDGDGKALIFLQPSSEDYAVSVMAYPGGKIVIGGYSGNDDNNDFAAVRLNSNGSLDASFDGDGKVFIPVGPSNDIAESMAIQPDGKILLAGHSYNGNFDFSIVRLNINGGLDVSFDGDGKQIIPVSDAGTDLCHSVTLLSNGKIFLGGTSNVSPPLSITSYNQYAAAQLNSDGSLDNSFDTDGKAIFGTGSFDDVANAVALHPNGNILLAGRSFTNTFSTFTSLARFKPNGLPEINLDDDGTEIIPSRNNQKANAAIVQSNGKILLAGSGYTAVADSAFSVTRLNYNGTPDLSFGSGGTTLIPVTGISVAQAIALQTDGKIVIAGYSTNAGGNKDFTIAKLTTSGILDNTFDGDGIKTISFTLSSIGYAIAIQPDGKIIVAGSVLTTNRSDPADFAVARINADGSTDNSFGAFGKKIINISVNDMCYAMKMQSDGKILLAGASVNGSSTDFAVVRLTTGGSLDISFDNDGIKMIDMKRTDDIAKGLAIQTDGKIVIAGYTFNVTDYDASVVRLNSNGSPDNAFDGDGKKIYIMPGPDEIINGMVLQVDGKIVLAGGQKPAVENYGSTFFSMRLLGGSVTSAKNESDVNKTGYRLLVPNLLHKGETFVINGLPLQNSITIVNAAGQMVFNQQNYLNNQNFGSLKNGLYYFTIKTVNKQKEVSLQTGKVIITD